MTTSLTFYFSKILGLKVLSESQKVLGTLVDLIVDSTHERPRVIGGKLKIGGEVKIVDFSSFTIERLGSTFTIKSADLKEIELLPENALFLVKHILDKQIIDVNGRKVVRVNDIRIASITTGSYLMAVDVGVEGLLRRLGFLNFTKFLLKPLGKHIPTRLILWDDVEALSLSNKGIRLAKDYSKLAALHPSDLADIIEDLDKHRQAEVFASLDEEKAADVLEELEVDAQRSVIDSLSVEKAADVLEKMPPDEAAWLLDELEDDKVEQLLSEMDLEAREEVKELMEYPDGTVGSIMTTDHVFFSESTTVDETLRELRKLKPETDTIYSLYVADDKERIIATVSLRDIVVSEPEIILGDIMNREVIHVHDNDKIDFLAEIIAKYNLLALPVVDEDMKMVGMVIIDDVVDILLKSRRRRI